MSESLEDQVADFIYRMKNTTLGKSDSLDIQQAQLELKALELLAKIQPKPSRVKSQVHPAVGAARSD
jgi:hypothetical protein